MLAYLKQAFSPETFREKEEALKTLYPLLREQFTLQLESYERVKQVFFLFLFRSFFSPFSILRLPPSPQFLRYIQILELSVEVDPENLPLTCVSVTQ
jgi:hypothetical protein